MNKEQKRNSESVKELHTLNGQNYVTITSAEGRTLLQRVSNVASPSTPSSNAISNKPSTLSDHHHQGMLMPVADFVVLEEKDYTNSINNNDLTSRKRTRSGSSVENRRSGSGGGEFFNRLGRSFKSHFYSLAFYQAIGAEFLGVALLTFMLAGFGVKLDNNPDNPGVDGSSSSSSAFSLNLHGELGSGLTVATIVWILGSVSGAHINPAVSLVLTLCQDENFDLIQCLFYVLAQLGGSVTGVFALTQLLPVSYPVVSLEKLGMTLVSDNLEVERAIGVECVSTCVLMLVVLACLDKKRSSSKGGDLKGSAPRPLAIGLTVTAGALFGGPYTGGSMNPARSFGPAFISKNWTNHWVYWVGPLAGALIAAVIYKVILKPSTKKTKKARV